MPDSDNTTNTTPFKVGDKVKVVATHNYYANKTGTVVEATDKHYVKVQFSQEKYDYFNFWPKNLILMERTALDVVQRGTCTSQSEVKVGDRVRIVECPYSHWVGKIVTIAKLHPAVYVTTDGTNNAYLDFLKSETTIEIISSQSPQQINQQDLDLLKQLGAPVKTTKENEMKPYAVLYQNFSTHGPASTLGNFTTEAEAREYAETYVYSLRSNLQNKQWFTITIVNTKTGQLVGSVVDAPPAVDWVK